MKKILLALVVLSLPSVARAQTPIIIDPNSKLAWDMPGVGQGVANGCTYLIAPPSGAYVPVIGTVTCLDPVAPAVSTTCTVNLKAQPAFTVSSGSVTMESTCNGITSLPSTPFAYVVIVIPIPANIRILPK